MDYRLNIQDLSNPDDLAQLKKAISEIADEADTLYSEVAPNGAISARIGRRCIYKNGSSYETWVNKDGMQTWARIQEYDANLVSIASPSRGCLPIYSAAGWISGATPTTANYGYYLRSAGFNDDPIYDLLDGAAFTNLDNIPSAAGIIPIANLATGTPDGTKFIRDDGALTTIRQLSANASGSLLEAYSMPIAQSTTSTSYQKLKELSPVMRSGVVSVSFDYASSINATTYARIYVNGVGVGTIRSDATGTFATYTQDITVVAGDVIQIYGTGDTASNQTSVVCNMKVKVAVPTVPQDNLGKVYRGAGVPNPNIGAIGVVTRMGDQGDIYIRTDGGLNTTLYVKENASTWTAK